MADEQRSRQENGETFSRGEKVSCVGLEGGKGWSDGIS